jgi:hypothetical protein
MGGGVPGLRRALPATALLALVVVPVALAAEPGGQSGSPTGSCDPIDPAHCLFPWPNDYFTEPDPTTATGRRVALDPGSMPRNRFGVPILPTEWNRSDGFSPGQLIVTKVPGLETQRAFEQTGAVPITEIEDSFKLDAPIVVLNADTGERHLIWSELDANPKDPDDVALLIRPAVNFEEGGHYIVALRNLKDEQGRQIKAQQPFRVYRDRIPHFGPGHRGAPPPLRTAVQHAPECRDQAEEPLPGMGLHGREWRESERANAHDQGRRVHPARGHRPRGHASAGCVDGAGVHGQLRHGLHALR